MRFAITKCNLRFHEDGTAAARLRTFEVGVGESIASRNSSLFNFCCSNCSTFRSLSCSLIFCEDCVFTGTQTFEIGESGWTFRKDATYDFAGTVLLLVYIPLKQEMNQNSPTTAPCLIAIHQPLVPFCSEHENQVF